MKKKNYSAVRKYYRLGEKKLSLRLAGLSKRNVDEIDRNVKKLVEAKNCGSVPDLQLVQWANRVANPRILEFLMKWELIEGQSLRAQSEAGRLLKPFIDDFVQNRMKGKHKRTKAHYAYSGSILVEFLGADKAIAKVTKAEVSDWLGWLKQSKRYAHSTRAKHLQRVKTMFGNLVDDQILPENPCVGIRMAKAKAVRNKDFEVNQDLSAKIIATLKEAEDWNWLAIFGLARYAGLRPCEICTLGWENINFESKKLEIDSPKTGYRECPLSPELRDVLLLVGQHTGKQGRAIAYNGASNNLSTNFRKMLGRHGFEAWGAPFNNIRKTRRTELEKLFPHHVVNSWMGHSSEVANKHYLRVEDVDWRKATGEEAGDNPSVDNDDDNDDDNDVNPYRKAG